MPNNDQTKKTIQDWWADNPMTYASKHGETEYVLGQQRVSHSLGSKSFFDQADQIFLKWNKHLHNSSGYFGQIFDYKAHTQRRVLEVGCGMGLMAMNWAQHGAHIVATDLNPVAVKQSRQRFDLFGVEGQILQSDGGSLPFRKENFSFIYSWGVLHHSPGLGDTIQSLYRLLEPGGKIGLMVYNRGSLRARYLVDYLEGFLHMENKFLNPLDLHSRYGDGAAKEGNPYTWPITQKEVRTNLMHLFDDVKINVLGSEMGNLIDLMLPGLGTYLMPSVMKNALASRWGWSLWITGEKRA